MASPPAPAAEKNQLNAVKAALRRNILAQATRRFVSAARRKLPRKATSSGICTRGFVTRLARLERRRSRAASGSGRRRTRFNLTRKEQRCERNGLPKWMEFLLGLAFGLSPVAVTFLVKLVAEARETRAINLTERNTET
jgi:hypothetical protein